MDRSRHQRLAQQDAGIVDDVSRRDAIGAVQDDVVVAQQFHDRRGAHLEIVRADVDVRIEGEQALARRLDLGAPDARTVEQHLPLQVRCVDAIVIDDPQRTDTRRREIQRCRRSETARTDDQHARGLQLFLPRESDLLQAQVPLIALAFGGRKRRQHRRVSLR